jgi:hypothetical protein
MEEYKESFNGDIFLQEKFKSLVNEHTPDVIIETGTHKADTTVYLASFGTPVITTEINAEYFEFSKKRLEKYNNVTALFGDSAKVLKENFETIRDKKIIAFLDAHWLSDMVLERELELFCDLKIKPIILIHDFYVPNTNLGYDTYNGQRYEYDFFKPYFDKLYSQDNYKHSFNSQATGLQRGVIFLEPKINNI